MKEVVVVVQCILLLLLLIHLLLGDGLFSIITIIILDDTIPISIPVLIINGVHQKQKYIALHYLRIQHH